MGFRWMLVAVVAAGLAIRLALAAFTEGTLAWAVTIALAVAVHRRWTIGRSEQLPAEMPDRGGRQADIAQASLS